MGFLDSVFGRRGQRAVEEQPVACPHCGTVLDTPPKSSRKCPACRDKIVVRTRRSDGAKLYLTENDAKVYDGERKADAFRNKALRAAANIGMDEKAFERKEKELLARSSGWSPGDVFWALAGEKAKEQALAGDLHGLSMTYFHQALWLYDEGRPYARLKVESEKARAQSYANGGCQELQVSGGAGCDNCKPFDGRVYPVEEAVKEWPVPSEECTNGWCLCMWNPVVRDLPA